MQIKLPKQKDRLEVVELRSSGGVAAGKTVPFPIPDETLYIPLTPREASLARAGFISHMTVVGDSLIEAGIYDRDKVVVQKVMHAEEISPETICIVLIRNSGDPVAKRIMRRNGMITLQACNPEVPDRHFSPDEIEIQGKITGLYQKPNKRGDFKR